MNEYPEKWTDGTIPQIIKDAAGWKCIRDCCRHEHDPANGYTLTVHHLDGNKANVAWWNLVALCQRCHLHIQGKVKMNRIWMFEHSDWIKPYVAGYYAHSLGYFNEHAEAVIRAESYLIDYATHKIEIKEFIGQIFRMGFTRPLPPIPDQYKYILVAYQDLLKITP